MTDDGGDGQTGTPLDLALFDAIRASIEDAVMGTANPTVRADTIIDEVVAARGSMASLDERLDVSINEDGTLKAGAISGFVTSTQAKNSLVMTQNMARNGDMYIWANGAASAPDEFTLSGAGAAVARTGSGEADTTSLGVGLYAAKLTFGANDAFLTQEVIPTPGLNSENSNLRTQVVSAAARVKTSVATQARIGIFDGQSTTWSSYHSGGGGNETLTVVHTIHASADRLDLILAVEAAGAAYFAGIRFVYSEFAPQDWAPGHVPVLVATDTRTGLLTNAAQNIGGLKTFFTQPVFKPGTGATADQNVTGAATASTGTAGSVGAGETDLLSQSLQANALAVNGRGVRITAWGTLAANANNKRVRLMFGTTVIYERTTADNNFNWRIEAVVLRTGAATQIATALGFNGAVTETNIANNRLQAAAPGQALSGAVTIKCTGTGTANNDIVQNGLLVETI